MTPRFLGVTPRFWSVISVIISGSYFFGGYTAVKLSYTKVSTLKKTLGYKNIPDIRTYRL